MGEADMNKIANSLETNAPGWTGGGGPQDLFYSRDEDWPYPRMVRGDGICLWDEGGARYIDVSSGPVASNLGHNNRHVIDAMKRQLDTLVFSSNRVSRTNENIALAETLSRKCGKGLERAFFVSGGSEAIDMAIKFCRQVAWSRAERRRTRLFSLMPSYHGGTLASITLSGDASVEEVFSEMAIMPERIEAPLTYRTPDDLTQEQNEDRILATLQERIDQAGAETCLAMFVEPVGGLASGCNVLSERFVGGLRRICDRTGMLMVFDEVMSGAGRTGRFLAAHHYKSASPDIVVLAKGIGAGYIPLGIMMATAELVDTLSAKTGFNYGHTANANPLACATGTAVLEEIEARDLIAHAAEVGTYFKDRLKHLAEASPAMGDVRGTGLLLAVEIVRDKSTKAPFSAEIKAPDSIRRHGLDQGLTIYARRTNAGRFGDWIMTSPPLITTKSQADEIVERLGRTLETFQKEAMLMEATAAS